MISTSTKAHGRTKLQKRYRNVTRKNESVCYHLHEILFILLNVIIFMFLEVLHKEDKRNQNWS